MAVLGAQPQDWRHLERLGLLDDLLPVVADPAAKISPSSKLATPGKVPSVYTDSGVVGIARWTERITKAGQVRVWEQDSRLGICIQTRRARALDIDVDGALAAEIGDLFEMLLGPMPARVRANSSKRLLLFTLADGEKLFKRSFRVKGGGLVELLGDGQQFVAVSTHPSGARYEWPGGLPTALPRVQRADLDAAWAAMVQLFGEPESEKSAGERKRGDTIVVDDPRARWLVEQGLVLAHGNGGQLHITCPWKDGHSRDSGPTECSYFPAGTGGYAQGHYVCLHASCSSRTDAEFDAALGHDPLDGFFEDVSDPGTLIEGEIVGREVVVSPKGLLRDKQGSILCTQHNIRLALMDEAWLGLDIRFDEFEHDVLIREHGTQGWRPLLDVDYVAIRHLLFARGFDRTGSIGTQTLREEIGAIAYERRFDSAIDWAGTLLWDGVPRMDMLFTRYFSAENSDYARACSRYAMTALAARCMDPGHKCDMVVVLAGVQGAGKSTGVQALAPDPSHFVEIDLRHADADQSRKLRGKLVAELPELRGLRTADLESIKAFITRTHEEWVPKYVEKAARMARRMVFFGTTNDSEFLADTTGERRWLPIKVGAVDTEALRRDRMQLWAEAVAVFKANGRVDWRAADMLAADARDEFSARSPWSPEIEGWLDRPDGFDGGATPRKRGDLTTAEIGRGALGLSMREIGDRRTELNIARAMRELGFENARTRVGGKQMRVWRQK